MALTVSAQKKAYDILYAQAEKLLKQHNPCNIHEENGKFVCGYDLEWCCKGCEHLGPTGCTVKALDCKLWLCGTVRLAGYKGKRESEVMVGLDTLRKTGIAMGIPLYPGSSFVYRCSKEQTFKGR